jgi:hypothetical protein
MTEDGKRFDFPEEYNTDADKDSWKLRKKLDSTGRRLCCVENAPPPAMA